MQILINTDHNIEGRESLAARVQDTVEHGLGRFGGRITREEVHLSEQNGDKGGQDDKRCMMEARVEGRPPAAVSHHAATLDQAVHGAVDKLKKSLESTLHTSI